MANLCSSLDYTSWSYHLPAPGPSSWPPHGAAWLSSPAAATFENDVLASALVRASFTSPSLSPTPSTSTATTSSASELSSSIPHDAPPSPLGRAAPVAASGFRPPQSRRRAGHVISKRKPRPSRRPAITYITADPANFRRMVQEITGLQVVSGAERGLAAETSPAPPPRALAALAFVLPTLDTSASFSLDRTPAPPKPEDDRSSGRAATTTTSAVDDWSLLLMQELEAPAVASAFPTLESWGMI